MHEAFQTLFSDEPSDRMAEAIDRKVTPRRIAGAEVSAQMIKMKANKAHGPHAVPGAIFKLDKGPLTERIAEVFSARTLGAPAAWKDHKGTLLQKKEG